MARTETVGEAIAGVPESLQRTARKGFAVASSISPEERKTFLDLLNRTMVSGAATVDLDVLSGITDLTSRDAGSVLSAFSVLVGLLGRGKFGVEELVQGARDVLFAVDDEPVVRAVAASIAEGRGEWKRAVEQRSLAAETLPALTAFEVSVDLRLGFKNNDIEDAVSVALIHLDTDANNQEVWLQMTRGDVQTVIEKLNNTLKQMDAAQKLFPAEGTKS